MLEVEEAEIGMRPYNNDHLQNSHSTNMSRGREQNMGSRVASMPRQMNHQNSVGTAPPFITPVQAQAVPASRHPHPDFAVHHNALGHASQLRMASNPIYIRTASPMLERSQHNVMNHSDAAAVQLDPQFEEILRARAYDRIRPDLDAAQLFGMPPMGRLGPISAPPGLDLLPAFGAVNNGIQNAPSRPISRQQNSRDENGVEAKKKYRRRGGRGRLGQKADSEYAKYLDEMNQLSRENGDEVLHGDVVSGHAASQVRFAVQPPSPSPMRATMQDEYSDEEEFEEIASREQADWAKLMTGPATLAASSYQRTPGVFDPVNGTFVNSTSLSQAHAQAASARPPTSSSSSDLASQAGRQSAPTLRPPMARSAFSFEPRTNNGSNLDVAAIRRGFISQLGSVGGLSRPSSAHSPSADDGQRGAFLDNRIFGELPGSISREPSPSGLGGRLPLGRRLFEQS